MKDDIVLRITATAICGSDLHLYRGKVPGLEDGDILGHEFMGVVEEAGPGVHKLERGDRVVVPFMIACGDCFFCERQLYAACETTNPQTGVLEGRGALIEMMSVPCARMLGAERVFLVDHHPYRLRFAERVWNVTPIDFDDVDDPAEAIVDATGGRGVDAVVDTVGFVAKGSPTETVLATMKIEGGSGFVLRQAIAATRRGGVVSVPGVYAGFIHAFMLGDAFDKGLAFRMGQTHARRFMPELLERIREGRLEPDVIVTHKLPLAEAARGYEIFDEKREDCRKVVLVP